jgi:hypothetical protein
MAKKKTVGRLKKAKRIREAGKQTEQEFFGKGGPLEVKSNPTRSIGMLISEHVFPPYVTTRIYQRSAHSFAVTLHDRSKFSTAYEFMYLGRFFSLDKAKKFLAEYERVELAHLSGGKKVLYGENPITVVGLANPGKKKHRSSLVVPQQIDQKTFNHWVKTGALKVTSRGDENTYGVTEFGHEYYVKDYGENPPRSVHANIEGIIYNRCIEIRAEKTGYKKGFYKHPFSRGSQVCIYALDNGDLLVHSKAGVKLWQPD